MKNLMLILACIIMASCAEKVEKTQEPQPEAKDEEINERNNKIHLIRELRVEEYTENTLLLRGSFRNTGEEDFAGYALIQFYDSENVQVFCTKTARLNCNIPVRNDETGTILHSVKKRYFEDVVKFKVLFFNL